jgi:hypothetical protein
VCMEFVFCISSMTVALMKTERDLETGFFFEII